MTIQHTFTAYAPYSDWCRSCDKRSRDPIHFREARPTPVEPEALLRAVIEEVEAEEKRWLEWWARGGKGSFVWKREAVSAAKEALNGS